VGQGSVILAFNATTVYEVQPFTKLQGQSKVYFPGSECIRLTAGAVGADEQGPKASKKVKKQGSDAGHGRWSLISPLFVKAMALADKILWIAGPPDVLDPRDPLAPWEARAGANLWAVSAANGEKLAEWGNSTVNRCSTV
jgi:hypothetical protein